MKKQEILQLERIISDQVIRAEQMKIAIKESQLLMVSTISKN